MNSTRHARGRQWLVLGCLALLAVSCADDDDGGSAEGGSSTTRGSALSGADAAPPSQGESPGCEATVEGTQIDYGGFAPAVGLDPVDNTGSHVGGTEIAAIYDVLIRFDQGTGEYVPQLAESLEPNDDYSVWTLTLRDGITYSDGTPLTAELVAENVDRFFAEGVRNVSSGFMGSITDMRALNELTLEVTLDAPWASFPFVFAVEPGMIVNTNVIGDDPVAFSADPPEAAGLGPYVVERHAPGEELVLRARGDYWGGPVCVERLRFTTVAGARATYDAFLNDELDVAFLRDPVVTSEVVDAEENSVFLHVDHADHLLINHAEGRPGADPRLREAIALAIDPELINERAYQGTLLTTKAVIQEDSRYYSAEISEPPYEADEAQRLVDEAKADGYDGSLDLVCRNTPPSPEVAVSVEALLEAVGFEVETTVVPSADLVQRLIDGNFDVSCTGQNLEPARTPMELLRQYHSESPANRSGYGSARLDKALEDLLAASSLEDQRAAIAEVNNAIVDDSVSVGIGATDSGIVMKPEVRGVSPTASMVFLFDDAYLDGADG